jgi:Mrp family chromosome partitioning ATPase
MTPRVATVLSAREWESAFVAHARESATVRLVLRAFVPDEVAAEADRIDVVVAGAETSWVTPARIHAWRRSGLRIVGIHPRGDDPARERLSTGGADEILPDDAGAEAIARATLLLEPASPSVPDDPPGRLVVVTGGRGAPGRTEVAVALAWASAGSASTLLVDGDLHAPSVAIRLGVPPRPDLTDAADTVLAQGSLPDSAVQHIGTLRLLVGSHRAGEPVMRAGLVDDLVDAARIAYDTVVVDAGPWPDSERLAKQATDAALVTTPDPSGIVRTARIASEWSGPPPRLVVNRAPRDPRPAISSLRHWVGLEPAAVIRRRTGVEARARTARAPHPRLLATVARLLEVSR